MSYLNEQNILLFLIQVFLLLGLARGLGELFTRLKQPPMTAEILVGILLGPTILGRFFPDIHHFIFPSNPTQMGMLETVSWLGVFFLLLEAGLEIDFASAWIQRSNALKIAVLDVVIPILIGFIFCLFLPDHYLVNPQDRIIFSIFLATVMAITAITIVTRTLHDLNISKTDLGVLIMSALSINDILGWLIFTLVLVFFVSGELVLTKIFFLFFLTLGFVMFCLTFGRHWTEKIIHNMKVKRMPEPSSSLTFICLLGILCGIIAQAIGIHALFGFLIAGIMAGGSKALSERTRQIISQMVFAVFVPLFFTSIGLRTDFFKNFDIFLSVFVFILSVMGKFLGAWIGTAWAKISKDDRLIISIAHTPGGMMEIVVGMVALQHNLITETVFIAIVFSAILSSLFVGPWLNYSLNRRKKISILEFFSKRIMIEELKSTEKQEAIKTLCELVSWQANMPSFEEIKRAVLERENIMGTAIEEGIALPHARLASLKRPIIAFGRSVAGIDWDSPDGKATHFIFLILTPSQDDDLQVQILRGIVQGISDQNVRKELMKAMETHSLWTILHKTFTSQQINREAKN